jgi:hypothetical protein
MSPSVAQAARAREAAEAMRRARIKGNSCRAVGMADKRIATPYVPEKT